MGLVFFTAVLTLGQFIFTIGGYTHSYTLMMLGRFVFACGGDCMGVAQSTIIAAWFKGKELNFATGFSQSLADLSGFA